MYFYFSPFSVQSRFTMNHYTSMHTHICTHVSDARAIYIMQIDFAEFCRGQCASYAHLSMYGVQMELWTTPLHSYFDTDN